MDNNITTPHTTPHTTHPHSMTDDQLVSNFLRRHAARPTGATAFKRRVMLHLPDTIYHIAIGLEVAGGVAAMFMLANIIETIDWSSIPTHLGNLQAHL